MLIQITDADIFRPLDLSLVRREMPCYNIEERGLTLAVCAYKPDVLAAQQAERDVLKNGSVTEAVNQICYSQNTHNNLLV